MLPPCSPSLPIADSEPSDEDEDDAESLAERHKKLVKDLHATLKDFQRAQRACAERENLVRCCMMMGRPVAGPERAVVCRATVVHSCAWRDFNTSHAR